MKFQTGFIALAAAMMSVAACGEQPKEQPQDNVPKKDTPTAPTAPVVTTTTGSFQKSLQSGSFSFEVHTSGEGSVRKLFIRSKGLEKQELDVQTDLQGTVEDARVADLNADGFPELLVFTQSAGSGGYANVLAFSCNAGKSMSQVYFPPTAENPQLKNGYMGHDSFTIDGAALVQEFPVYKTGDPNSNPTGGIRRVRYKLVNGEASRKLVVDNISESAAKE